MLRNIHTPVDSIALFQAFASDLIALKRSVQRAPSDAGTIDLTAQSDNGTAAINARAATVWNRVITLLDRQSLEATRRSGPSGLEFHREAIYVMAALADETFVHLDWEGRDFWLSHLLEARLFRTHAAGDIFFRRLEDLLRREDEAAAEIAAVYLFALALGFRGKYWGADEEAILDSYPARLFAFIVRWKPEMGNPVERIFPDAYRNTIQDGAPRDIPSTRKWLWMLAGAFAIWLLVAQLIWWNLTNDLNAKLCVVNGTCAAAAPGTTPSPAGKAGN